MGELPKIYEPILLEDITSAVREADEGFKKTGGSSRHWVDDWFLECLAKRGLQIFKAQAVYALEAELEKEKDARIYAEKLLSQEPSLETLADVTLLGGKLNFKVIRYNSG